MKHSIKRNIFALAAVALLVILSATSALAQGTGLVRFVHAIPGASGVDIYSDGQLAASNLEFGASDRLFRSCGRQSRSKGHSYGRDQCAVGTNRRGG